MATWHQKKAGMRLYHETKWTVVDDPPHDCTGLTLCESEEEAEAVAARLKARGREHVYVLAPARR